MKKILRNFENMVNIYLLDVKRFEDNLFIKEINNKYCYFNEENFEKF